MGLKFADGTWDEEKASGEDADGDGIPDELENVGVYFRTSGANSNARDPWKTEKRTPRAVLVDLEPGTLDVIKAGALKDLFDPATMKFGSNGAGNNWAKGHYTEGAEIVEEVIDIIRKEVEKADCAQGFQLFHSLGGGTGSGMGTLVLLKLRDAYPDRILATFSVYPSPKVSDTVVEPYNAVLSSHQLLENSDETFIIDNEALYNISHNVLKLEAPSYADLNYLISCVMAGVTASLRFPGKLNGDLRKLGVNLVPFPRLHFFLIAQAPLQSKDNQGYVKVNVLELTNQCFSPRNFFSNVKPDDGKYMTASLLFRGKMSTQEVDEIIEKRQSANSDDFVEWIPNNMKTSVVGVPPKDTAQSCTFVANTTALKGIFQRLATQFGSMYKRKAFLHWYKGEGMDEMEFQEADKNVRDLITEYQDKQDAVVDLDEDEDDEEDDEEDGDEEDEEEEDEDY